MKRIELRVYGELAIISANAVSNIYLSNYYRDGSMSFQIGSTLKYFGNELTTSEKRTQMYHEVELAIRNVESFVFDGNHPKEKMVIEIGEFKNLVEEGYIIVSFDVINDADSPYKIDDNLVSVAAANSTIRFDVKVCDETLSDDDAIAEARKRLCSIIGEREYFDSIDLSRIRPSYDVSYVRVSYE